LEVEDDPEMTDSATVGEVGPMDAVDPLKVVARRPSSCVASSGFGVPGEMGPGEVSSFSLRARSEIGVECRGSAAGTFGDVSGVE
jgi:hypothetical protein